MELDLSCLNEKTTQETLADAVRPKIKIWYWSLVEIDPTNGKWNVVKSFAKPVKGEGQKPKASKKKVIDEFGTHEEEQEEIY